MPKAPKRSFQCVRVPSKEIHTIYFAILLVFVYLLIPLKKNIAHHENINYYELIPINDNSVKIWGIAFGTPISPINDDNVNLKLWGHCY